MNLPAARSSRRVEELSPGHFPPPQIYLLALVGFGRFFRLLGLVSFFGLGWLGTAAALLGFRRGFARCGGAASRGATGFPPASFDGRFSTFRRRCHALD